MDIEKSGAMQSEKQEPNLVEVIGKLWCRRKLIFKITACFLVFGVLVYFLSPKEYTASCEIVPQTSKSTSSSSMSRLASLAGINLNSLSPSEQLLSPLVYPNVLSNMSLQRDLLRTEINLKGVSEPVTLMEYLTDKKYQKFSLMGTLLKYTIGLPGLIAGAIKGEPKEVVNASADKNGIIVLTAAERKAVKALKNIVSIKVDEKKGYLTIYAHMPESYAAAQVVESTMNLLQKYVTEFKIDKVQSNLEFIQGRYDELKQEYEELQMARARFKDANLRTTSNRVKSEFERLNNQYNLAFSIFSEIATQLEQAKIQVKETTPILTVINPVFEPVKKSKPNGMMILVGFMFLGLLCSCSYVLLAPFIRETLHSLRKEESDGSES